MKYRIIKEFDDNGLRHFEVWLWEKGLITGYKWRPVQEQYVRCSVTRRFKNILEVKQYIKSLNVKREIITESET